MSFTVARKTVFMQRIWKFLNSINKPQEDILIDFSVETNGVGLTTLTLRFAIDVDEVFGIKEKPLLAPDPNDDLSVSQSDEGTFASGCS